MLIRLQKFLSRCGIASRRKAEKLILDNQVYVNGTIISSLGTSIDPTQDIVTVKGKRIRPEKKIYIFINKPKGVICSMRDDFGRHIVSQFLNNIKENVFHVGRLDKDSEGLLLLTNDGDFAHKVLHPKKHVAKTYIVESIGTISDKDIYELRKGILLDGKITLPVEIRIKQRTNKHIILEMTLYEGKKRQIRRMLKIKNLRVTYLKRIKIGNLHLGNLKSGCYKIISQKTAYKIFEKN